MYFAINLWAELDLPKLRIPLAAHRNRNESLSHLQGKIFHILTECFVPPAGLLSAFALTRNGVAGWEYFDPDGVAGWEYFDPDQND